MTWRSSAAPSRRRRSIDPTSLNPGRRCQCNRHTGLEDWHGEYSRGYAYHKCGCDRCYGAERTAHSEFYSPLGSLCRGCGIRWKKRGPGKYPVLCPKCSEDHKWCSICQQMLLKDEFGSDRSQRDGLNNCCLFCQRAKCAAQRAKPRHREVAYAREIALAYGATPADRAMLFAYQEGRCALCGRTEDDEHRRLGIDHDHVTGALRGLLCRVCNQLVGLVERQPSIGLLVTAKVHTYLTKPPYQTVLAA